MKEKGRKTLRVIGIIWIVVAVGVIGYSAWNLISTEINTNNSLAEAEQLFNELDSLAPAATQPAGDTAGSPANGTAAPDGAGLPDGTDASGNPVQPTAASADPSAVAGQPGAPGSKTPTKSPVTGRLIFDSLGGRKVAVLEGTSDAVLARGAAHHPRSSKPGGTNCVVFGHRNTVFRDFGKIKAGDTIRYEVPGKTYVYKVIITKVIEPNSREIFASHGQPALTLVTCYPFHYVGAAPQRYLVVGTLVS